MSRTIPKNIWASEYEKGKHDNGILVGWVETIFTRLPLKAIQVAFKVRGCVAEVCVTQVFHQDNPCPVDCEYQFALPADSVVFGCEVRLGGRNLVAQIRERTEAIRMAEKHKEAGHRTLLVESERPNLFTMELGNLQYQDLAEVSLRYMQPLRRVGKEWCLEVPLTPGVRYIPGQSLARPPSGHGTSPDTTAVPDGSRVSPIRIDEFHPDAAWFELEGVLDSRGILDGTLRSLSHAIVTEVGAEDTRVRLQRCDEFPDRDLVVRWMEPESEERGSRAWVEDRDGVEYGLLELRPAISGAQDRSAPMDLYFLLDSSGSMSGRKWEKAVEAVQIAAGLLKPRDRMNLYRFSNHCARCLEAPSGREVLTGSEWFQALLAEPPSGGTQLFPALKTVLADSAEASEGRRHAIILITDGQVGNEPEMLKWLRERRLPPIHSFGIDLATNDGFLVPLAEISGGSFHSLRPEDEIADCIVQSSGVFSAPDLSALQLADGWEWATQRIPELYRGQVRYLSVRRTLGRTAPLGLSGYTPLGKRVPMEIETRRAESALPHLWFHQMRLNSAITRNDVQGAIECSLAANILCPFTAYVTWDESEKVARSGVTLVQPSPNVLGIPPSQMYGLRGKSQLCYMARGIGISPMGKYPLSAGKNSSLQRMTIGQPLETNRMAFFELTATVSRYWPRYSQVAREDMDVLFDWLNVVQASTIAERTRWFSQLVETLEKLYELLSSLGYSEAERATASERKKLDQLVQECPPTVRSGLEKAFPPS